MSAIRRRKGGVLPLATVVPVLVAVGKTVALGALGAAASHKTKKWMDKKKYKKRPTKRRKFDTVRPKRVWCRNTLESS